MKRLALSLALVGCGAPPPKVVAPVAAPLPPLPRLCQEALPLASRTVGELARTVRSLDRGARFSTRPCDKTTAWPVAFAETGEGRPPIGMAVLQMEGDALLTFDARDRDSPLVKLCAELEAPIGERHRVRAIALWESGDEAAFEPEKLEASRAELAWLELLARAPSDCALGRAEEPGQAGDAELRPHLRCAMRNFVTPAPPGCDAPPPAPAPGPSPTAEEVERAAARTHRHVFPGRATVRDGDLQLERPERCFHEPAPATHDVCLAEYTRAGQPGERWYGRSDVTRTGTGGEKNYVDSYLTFQLLKRLEAERRKGLARPPAPAKK